MEEWRLIDLGICDPYMAQTFYEAVALAISRGLSPNTIIFAIPGKPYVCIGYHQILEACIDVSFCEKMNLPIIRRMFVGGGAVYLIQIKFSIRLSQTKKVRLYLQLFVNSSKSFYMLLYTFITSLESLQDTNH